MQANQILLLNTKTNVSWASFLSKLRCQVAFFLSTLWFSPISPKLKKRFEKLFKKSPKSLKYKGLHCFQGGIFFVNTSQKILKALLSGFFHLCRKAQHHLTEGQHHFERSENIIVRLRTQMNEVEALPQMMLRQVANDVGLRPMMLRLRRKRFLPFV